MSVRLRETIKKIRRNLSLRTPSKDDRKSDEDDDDRAKVRDASLGVGGFWSRHRIGSSSGAAKFSISTDAGLDRLPASWPAVAAGGSLGDSQVRMPAPTSDEEEYDDGDDEDEGRRSHLAKQVDAARLAESVSVGSGADSGGFRVFAADDRLLLLQRENQQQPETRRTVKLIRETGSAGFGFVAGGQRPMTVRTVDQGGPSEGLLLPGDQIVEVNGVNTESLPQSAVLELIRRDGDEVQLTVRQPPQLSSTRSILRGNSDDGRKLRKTSSRVRFSEAIQEVDADEHTPATMKTFQDEAWTTAEPREPTLKIFLENNQTKTVQFDESTTVEDLLRLLLQKLEISEAADHFALVIREPGSSESRHFRAFSRDEPLVEASSAGGKCSLRLLYAPKDPYDLLKNDEMAFDYLYKQCCNDLMDDNLLPDACASQSAAGIALRLASLFMLEHALIQGIPPNKVTAKKIDKEFGLRTFVTPSLAAKISPKILHRKLDSFFKLNRGLAAPGQKRVTALQARLHFMQIAAGLPLFCARRFAVRSFERDKLVDMTLLVGPNCGVSRAVGYTFQRMVPLEDVHDMKIINPPEDQYNGMPLKLVEFKCGNQLEVARLYMREALAYDFCTFLNSYRTTLTGNAAAQPIYLAQTSRSRAADSHGYGRLTSNGDVGDVFLPPADYDEAENNTDVDDGDDDVSAVNSALAAAFDDLDDGLLLADTRESTVGAGAIQLAARDSTFDNGAASGDSRRDVAGDAKYGSLRLGPAGPSDALSASSCPIDRAVVLASGALTKHDEEIGIQMLAIDAATSSDRCRRGDDESGIDSDSEDSGNETLNSVDTNSSFAPAEAVHCSERLSPSRTLARGRRGAVERASEVPAVSAATTAAVPHRRPSAELRSAPRGGCGASLTRITFGAMAHGESIIGADADDVSTEDDEDEDDRGEKEKATMSAVNGSGGVSRIAAVVQPVQYCSPITVGMSREESERNISEVMHRQAATIAASSASQKQQSVRPSDLRITASVGAEARVPGKRPASDGFFVGEQWRAQSSAIGGDASRSPHRLVRQDAIERSPASPPPEAPSSVFAETPSPPTTDSAATNPSAISKARGARSATVASSSRLAQAFMKLSASSKASGSYDFCPATPPRLRPISSPFNIRSTAQGVLASAKPVRASLSDARETWAASDTGSPSSSVPVFRVPRPSCPPPPPPPAPVAASGVFDGAAGRNASLRSPTTSGSSGGGDADAAPSAHWGAAATPLRVSETRAAVRDAEPKRDDFLRRNGSAAGNAATSPSVKDVRQRRQHRPQSDMVVIAGGSHESSPIERRRSVGAQFTVRSSSGLSLRAVADADSVSYKLDSHPIDGSSAGGGGVGDGGSATSPQAASHSAAASASPQTKKRVLARILDALKPRKKSASLSRAASAIELTTATGGKGSSLPRWLGNAPKQRPSILTKPRDNGITLLRATSYGDCDGGSERQKEDEEEEEEELFGSLGDAWPVSRLNSSLPAAEICAIDTTATSPRETWSRSGVLETFLAHSPAVAVAPGSSIYTRGDSASKSYAQAQQVASHLDVDVGAAYGSTIGRHPACSDTDDCRKQELFADAAAAHTAAFKENAAASTMHITSQEARASETIEWSSTTGCNDCRIEPGANEDSCNGDGICSSSSNSSSSSSSSSSSPAVMSPLYDTGTTVVVENGYMLSKESRYSEQIEQKKMLAIDGIKPFPVEPEPVSLHIQCVNMAAAVDAAAVDQEEVSLNKNEFSTVLEVKQCEAHTVEVAEASTALLNGSPTTLHVAISQASLATMMGIALTEALKASGLQPPDDAAQACAVVDRLLEALKGSGYEVLAGSPCETFHVDTIEWIESQSVSTVAAAVAAAAAAVQRLLLEAQRMVGECKQMVAAIARRQRNVASSSEAASGKDADSLREEERCCVVRSFCTFSRLMGAVVPYAAAVAMASRSESAIEGWNQHTSISLLRDRLLVLGHAYATALQAAVSSPSSKGPDQVTEKVVTVDTGTSQASGVVAERPESRTDSDVRTATAVAESSCGPVVGGSDEAVRRLMTIATELATALGGLIRLLRQGPLLPANTTTSDADEI